MAETNKKSDLKNPLLSIIIPHHGGVDILNECLSSLEKSTYEDYEIIIVDNASKDNSIKEAKNKFPYINVLTQNQNLGYAGGCNKGAIHSRGEFLLFLNNDTIHELNWIEPLVHLISNDRTIGSIQPKILNTNQKNLFDYAGGSGGFIDLLCYPFIRGRIFNTIETDEGQYNDKKEIFWASGCAFITRKDLFLKILFDERFFTYMEEIDYSWKTILLGYKNFVEPKSIIYHTGGTLKNRGFFKSYFNHRNSMIIFLTNHNPLIMLLLLIPKILLEILSLVRYLLIFNINGFVAQICSYLWILIHPIYLISRVARINNIKRTSLYFIINKMLRGSIVIKYFLLRNKKYSDVR